MEAVQEDIPKTYTTRAQGSQQEQVLPIIIKIEFFYIEKAYYPRFFPA